MAIDGAVVAAAKAVHNHAAIVAVAQRQTRAAVMRAAATPLAPLAARVSECGCDLGGHHRLPPIERDAALDADRFATTCSASTSTPIGSPHQLDLQALPAEIEPASGAAPIRSASVLCGTRA